MCPVTPTPSFERGANRLDASADDIHLAKFAYCALIDEVVLMSKLRLRDVWERRPLQLEFFGEQLAGEHFFVHLETLRQGGAARLQALKVFHMCLLMGFQGRYILEGSEKLNYLTGRLGDDIAQLRCARPSFAPHWAAPDRVAHALKRDVPLWVIASVFALVGLLAFFKTALHRGASSGGRWRYRTADGLCAELMGTRIWWWTSKSLSSRLPTNSGEKPSAAVCAGHFRSAPSPSSNATRQC